MNLRINRSYVLSRKESQKPQCDAKYITHSGLSLSFVNHQFDRRISLVGYTQELTGDRCTITP